MWRRGTRRILWLSHCNDLREDARRDMTDLGIHVPSYGKKGTAKKGRGNTIDVWPAGNNTPNNGALSKHVKEGVFFATYNLLTAGTDGVGKKCKNLGKRG